MEQLAPYCSVFSLGCTGSVVVFTVIYMELRDGGG